MECVPAGLEPSIQDALEKKDADESDGSSLAVPKILIPSLALDHIEPAHTNDSPSPPSQGPQLSGRLCFISADGYAGSSSAGGVKQPAPCSPRMHQRVVFPYGSKELSADTFTYAVRGAIVKAQVVYDLQLLGQSVDQPVTRERALSEDAICTIAKPQHEHGKVCHGDPRAHAVDTNLCSNRSSQERPLAAREAAVLHSKRRIVLVCVEHQPVTPAAGCVAVKWFVDNLMRKSDIVVLLSLWEQEDFLQKIVEFAKHHGPHTPRLGSPRQSGSPRHSGGSSPRAAVSGSHSSFVSPGLRSPRGSSERVSATSPLAGSVTGDVAMASRIGRLLNNSCCVLECAHKSFIADSRIEGIDVFPLVLPVASKGMLSRVGIHRPPAGEVICRAAKILQCDAIVIESAKVDGTPTHKGRKSLMALACRDVSEHGNCTVVQTH
eukprot:GHVQ01013158.1.p1 GENE.GHVQ01013158.1~~GHVQ01013158.1.p1  ORF type:complete len:435 (+),score=41.02 GHVQ01013158.1:48-1352(+)